MWRRGGHKKSLMCGLGVAVGCRISVPSQRIKGFKVFKGLERFKGFKGLEGFRAGKRQTWTPIRSH